MCVVKYQHEFIIPLDCTYILDGSFHPVALYIYCIIAREVDNFPKKEISLLQTYELPYARISLNKNIVI